MKSKVKLINIVLSMVLVIMLAPSVFSQGGVVPSGLPIYFGFGAMDNFASPWKSGQGTTCWDYSYTYLTQGWRTWNGDDPSYPIEHAKVFEPMGQHQVVTFYYVSNNPSQYTGTAFMTTYFNDLKLLFQKINQYATKKVIVHMDPDLLGFWTSYGYTATTTGVVAVGSTGISEIASVENNIRGWNRAIRILRDTYAPSKALIATHISGWCFGFDILNSSIDQATMNTRVNNITTFINSIENGYPSDLFFVDPADRDADWRRLTNGDGNLYWTDPSHTYLNARSFGKLGAMVDLISTNLARRGMMWQIPVGNTYFKTCSNTTGHYRDNYAQNFIPSLSANGTSGTPGDAYSSTVTSMGPTYWGQRGIIGILFGPGDTGCTHLFDNRADGITNPTFDSGPGGPSYDVWGQANSVYSDDDGGYVRLAVARYCSKGKFAFYTPTYTITGTPPTATRTPSYTPTTAICATNIYDGETATTKLSYGGFWSSSGAVTEIAAAANAGAYGMAMRVTWTAYYAGMGWSWAGFWDTTKVFDASSYSSVEFYMRVTAGTTSAISVAISDTITASAAVSVGVLTTSWQKISIPLASFTGVDLTRIWAFSFTAGGVASGDFLIYMDNFAFANPCSTPTYTITGTPPTKTRTPTATRTLVVCTSINYDGETGFTDLASGGAWAQPTSSTATEVTTYAHGGTKSLQFNFTWISGSWGGGGWNWAGWVSAQASDLTQAVNLQFWVRTASGLASSSAVNLQDNTAAASNSFTMPVITSTWQQIVIPLSFFTGINKAAVWEFDINVGGSVSGNIILYFDDFVFVTQDCRTATPTCTRTRTGTATGTPMPTASNTGTPTRTATATNTVPTNTYTNTPTRTGTGTPTNGTTSTFTRTASPTYTRTVTGTYSRTPTQTRTRTATPTYTNTMPPATSTFTRTQTGTYTRTVTGTYTATRTATPSYTNTVPPSTSTFTRTQTGTYTRTPANTPVNTPTFTATRTPTPTYTRTVTSTFTRTQTGTFTATRTNSPSPTISNTWTPGFGTLTNTPTISATASVSPSGTNTITPTQTWTNSASPTRTASATASGSPSASASVSPINTYTRTPTFTNTRTRTPSMTPSRTVTPAYSATPSVSPQNTYTRTPTRTNTNTPGDTATYTFTRTGTPTYTNTVPPATSTFTITRTQTPVVTDTASPTVSPTAQGTFTNTPTITRTWTNSASPTRTATPTFTATRTYTETLQPTATRTATGTTVINTATNTAVIAATATYTQTTGGTPGTGLLDDLSDCDTENLWGGYWYSFSDAGSTSTYTSDTPGYEGAGDCAARLQGTVGAGGYAVMGTQLNPNAGTGTTTDISSCTGISFYAYGDGDPYILMIPYTDAAGGSLTGWDDYKYTFTPPAGVWTLVTIPFSAFTQAGWGTIVPITTVLAGAKDLHFRSETAGTVDLWVDDVTIYGCAASPTPTANTGMLDDLADCDTENNWGGYWYSFSDAGSTSTYTSDTFGYDGAGDCSAWLEGIVGAGGYAVMGTQLNPNAGSGVTTDISNCTGIQFYAYGDGNPYILMIPYTDASGGSLSGWDDYKYTFTPPAGAWTLITIPFTAFTQAGWGTIVPITTVLAGAKDIHFRSETAGLIDLWVDNVEIYGCVLASPTPTDTELPTVTNTPLPVNTNTTVPTVTNTIILTNTYTPTVTMTGTRTYTVTLTPTTVPGGSIITGITAPAFGIVGQQVTIIMTVFNNGTVTIDNITASVLTISDPAALTLAVAPSSAIAGLAPAAGGAFTWVYDVVSASPLVTLSGNAGGFNSITSAPVSSTATISNVMACLDPTATFTATPTVTATVTATPSATVTVTYTYTVTLSATRTFTMTATSTSQNTATFTLTITPTSTKTPDAQAITQLVPYPNPVDPSDTAQPDIYFGFTINQKDPEFIGIKVYTASYRLIKKLELTVAGTAAAVSAGRLAFGKADLAGLSNGTYFYYLYAVKGGLETRSKIDKFIIIKR